MDKSINRKPALYNYTRWMTTYEYVHRFIYPRAAALMLSPDAVSPHPEAKEGANNDERFTVDRGRSVDLNDLRPKKNATELTGI